MKQYLIKGGIPLRGEVTIGGAKNAALGIIVAAIMANEPVRELAPLWSARTHIQCVLMAR